MEGALEEGAEDRAVGAGVGGATLEVEEGGKAEVEVEINNLESGVSFGRVGSVSRVSECSLFTCLSGLRYAWTHVCITP